MWYLLLIIVLVFNQHTMIQPWRVWIGGVPISLYEMAIVAAILSAVVFKPGVIEPLDKGKRNYLWLIIVLYSVSAVASTIIGITSKAPLYNVFQTLKVAWKLPAGVLCGYLTIRNLKQARWTIKFIGFLCCLMCIFVSAAIARGSSIYGVSGEVGEMRTVSYNTSAAGVFAGFLVYSAAVNRRYFSHTAGLVILAMSVIACFGTLSKSDWVPLFLSILAVVWFTPKELRIYSWRALFTSGLWSFGTLFFGFLLAWTVLHVDMIAIVKDRLASLLQPLEAPTGPYISRWLGIKYEISIWLHSTIIFGAGFGSVELFRLMTGAEAGFAHNTFTNMLAQAGIAGLASLVSALIICYRLGKRMVLSNNGDLRAIGALAVVAAFYCVLTSILTMGLAGERLGIFFGIVVGMAIKCYRFYDDNYEEYEVFSEDSEIYPNDV